MIESDSEDEELPKPAENLPKGLQEDPSLADNQDISVPVDMRMQTDDQADGQLIIAAFQASNDGAPEYRTKWDGKSLKDSLTYSVVIDSPHLGRDLVGAELKLRWLMNRFFTPHAYTCHDWCWVQLWDQGTPVWWPFGLVRWHRI